MLNLPTRTEMIQRLRAIREIPVLILGGGINGAGLLRELAINGLDALLIDRGDFASGATSASSRMIHGGLRYLENGEFRLVNEALQERDRLLENAPHAVKPLPTTIPIVRRWSGIWNSAAKFFNLASKPAERGSIIIRIGLTFYDFFTRRHRRLPTHIFTSRKRSLELRPMLRNDIVCTATYYDAWIASPERLCLEVLDDAMQFRSSVLAANYIAFHRTLDNGNVELRDTETGEVFVIRPKIVVNACGAWIDSANAQLGLNSSMIGGTKGSHLVVEHEELYQATQGQQLFFENHDGRICLFFPLHGKVLAGTTDIRIQDANDAVCDDDEIEYILQSIRIVFPSIQISKEQIISTFCGVRPLPRSDSGSTGQISRDHHCKVTPAESPKRPWPIYSLIGGKWTSFRAFSEQVADLIFVEIPMKRRASSTELKIGAARRPASGLASNSSNVASDQDESQPISDADLLERWANAERIEEIATREAVVHLDDFWLRRTPLALFVRLDQTTFDRISRSVANHLAWDDKRWNDEILQAQSTFAKHRIRIG
jgi:glycerol-3-phosphate dehydrogenase